MSEIAHAPGCSLTDVDYEFASCGCRRTMSEIEITQEAIGIWHHAISAASASGIAFKPAADRRGAEVVQMYLDSIRQAAREIALDEAAKVAASSGAYDDSLQRAAGCATTGQRIATAIRKLKEG